MLKAICDKCETTEEIISSLFSKPKGWSDITISGNITILDNRLSRQSFKMLLCTGCTGTIFDLSEEPKKTLVDQFREIAADYLEELAEEIIAEAMENH